MTMYHASSRILNISIKYFSLFVENILFVWHCAGIWDVVMSKPDMVPTLLELTVKSWR